MVETKESLTKEIEKLMKRRDEIKAEIQSNIAVFNQDAEKKIMSARKEASSVEESKKKLASDREELERMANSLKLERAVLTKEKEEAKALKEDANRKIERIGAFMMVVRRESEKL